MPPPSEPTQAHRLAALGARWLGPENPERVIYGVIVIGSLLATESGLHDGYLETIAGAVIGLSVYWLAHAYAQLLGQRMAERTQLSPGALGHALVREAAILRGASLPLVPLLIGWVAGVDQSTAVNVAVWTSVATLIVLELIAGLHAHATPGEIVLQGAVGALMGLAILALKVIAH